ncbi:MAG TPA: S-methyl-5'-thioadenosine phosphorylase [Acidimicrobiales bacterium]|nr:S-methyl-5'-thioadenosine phosphorylase [Acidimicrobiales bacterium]
MSLSGSAQVSIGILGGSGFYELTESAATLDIDTPFGAPSAPVTIAALGGTDVAFLPRHGVDHTIPPHRINVRANLWALHSLGVRRLFSPCAVGSLRPDRHPGDMVIVDQLVDRTWGRPDTYFDGPELHHSVFADPYCPALRTIALEAGRAEAVAVHDGGTVVVVNGPRFSTRAESRWFRSQGWDVINMTQYPEAALARELGMCFAGIALVTDYDTGAGPEAEGDAVSMETVFAILADNIARVRGVLARAVASLHNQRDILTCECAAAGGRLPPGLSLPASPP